jgi:hypothetical protein
MTTRDTPFGDAPFSLAEGRLAGIGRGALAGPVFEVPFRGVRQRADAAVPLDSRRRAVHRARQYAQRMTAGQFFSHDTALAIRGFPLPVAWSGDMLHVSVHRPQQSPRIGGILGHRLQTRDNASLMFDGLPVEDPVRAWTQAGALWPVDDLVAAGDFLVARRRPLATLAELADEVVRTRQNGRLREALPLIRAGAESSQETRLRLVLTRGGLPEPELNVDILADDGRFLGRGDLVFRRWRVLTEYDGRQHADSVEQFERDADRWYDFERSGWRLVRILRPHLRADGALALARVRSALIDAGWRP